MTDSGSITSAAEEAADVTLLVNNAGVIGARSLLLSPIAEIRDTFETNLFGPLELTRAFAPALAAAGGGAIVNVHSVLSWLASPGAYSPSKAALWGLTNTLRLELTSQGTQVLGAVLTRYGRDTDVEEGEELADLEPEDDDTDEPDRVRKANGNPARAVDRPPVPTAAGQGPTRLSDSDSGERRS